MKKIPTYGTRLTATKSCHNRVHISCHEVKLPVICLRGSINAVRFVWFNNGNNRFFSLFTLHEIGKKTCYCAGHCSHARLQKYMCRKLSLHLLNGLQSHRRIALHDPSGNILIPLPGGILHHNPAFLLGRTEGQTHSLVIVHIRD